MPTFAGATEWVNSGPLDPDDLRGRVVLVDFWTLTCINWLRTEPYIRAWAQAYEADGLVVVGVHTPEFSFEHDVDLVRQATAAREITYPVVLDNDYAVWTAYDNHFWPALYFVDREGVVRDAHFGEGRYVESERLVQRLLGVEREPVAGAVVGRGVEAEADWDTLRTPESYLGYARGGGFASDGAARDERRVYRFPGFVPFNQWALDGEWLLGREKVELTGAEGGIVFHFQARDAHLVLSNATGRPIPFQVFLDGAAPGDAHGVDVDADGAGVLREGRLYQLVRQPDTVTERILEIRFDAPGAAAYAFTCG
ncbi:Thiol-disulfide isomerase or thioredoxin [Asanoa hainanensis]|uniref:Thiol-disulfide isomerase or thioredoxin n=1 Tax=Asanoa hainanensis TaxID=560556 RepID=A0A239PDL6_9ACTN|nr:redoxin domain-containing protein [Asanoa hainanensis]SNT65151.1 Thiol-disulfide isomerase or thioredoxin [Asanoa hainanensis]